MICRHCNSDIRTTFLDLGYAPPSNSYLAESDLSKPEVYFPLRTYVCEKCFLVQTADFVNPGQIFNKDYKYFSSTAITWVEHTREYATRMIDSLGLDQKSFVVEIASNDGCLLRHFVQAKIPCLGVEPTKSTAFVAESIGVKTICEFFDSQLAKQVRQEGKGADLIVANNVYAHVPNINDFTYGLSILLNDSGLVTLEFPHILKLIQETQFDTIYHEHYSYFSLGTVQKIFKDSGLVVVDVEEIPTHGGSLRVYGRKAGRPWGESNKVSKVLNEERKAYLDCLQGSYGFDARVKNIKLKFLEFLISQKRIGKKIAAYGAAAKGNTLLNYFGVKQDLIEFVCDAAPSKQGLFMPGSHIPIFPPAELKNRKPDWIVILPWNIREEVMRVNEHVREWGGRFVCVIPDMRIF